jgi:hypothetical protein
VLLDMMLLLELPESLFLPFPLPLPLSPLLGVGGGATGGHDGSYCGGRGGNCCYGGRPPPEGAE